MLGSFPPVGPHLQLDLDGLDLLTCPHVCPHLQVDLDGLDLHIRLRLHVTLNLGMHLRVRHSPHLSLRRINVIIYSR